MQFGLSDDRQDGEYSDVGLVEISEIFVMQGDFVYGVASLDRVYSIYPCNVTFSLPEQKPIVRTHAPWKIHTSPNEAPLAALTRLKVK